ncbi:MAG: hypothetical protein HKN21_08885 [Candidatus Eisenbacteria bacterium]|uniref:Winged helix DNA-binding domain-containing protein n=1 Tax=Eiseniibacteriota bacterium TaxID=2212470 RepID=A0A7Y2H2N1_UNCEI|nr:hypothetical protein [Candidatus Eisenbacteria bacterium]
MKQLLLILVLVAIVALGVFFFRGGESPLSLSDGPEFATIFSDAKIPGSSRQAGPSYPSQEQMDNLRAEWHSLAPADSTLLDALTQEWIYTSSAGPNRLTNITQISLGKDLSLKERLKFGEVLAKHPEWCLGSMSHFPAIAAVLNGTEKSVLQYLAKNDGGFNYNQLGSALDLSEEELTKAVDAFVELRWISKDETVDPPTFDVVDADIANGGGLCYLTFSPMEGRTYDVVSLESALRNNAKSFKGDGVDLMGNCAETGIPIKFSVRSGRLRTGKPGKAFAVATETTGATNGVFSSKQAFETWKSKHAGVTTTHESTVPAFFNRLMAGS